MKKVILILGLSLMSLVAFAGNDTPVTKQSTSNNIEFSINVDALRPVAPKEATFEDDTLKVDINKIKPTTPKEADFNE